MNSFLSVFILTTFITPFVFGGDHSPRVKEQSRPNPVVVESEALSKNGIPMSWKSIYITCTTEDNKTKLSIVFRPDENIFSRNHVTPSAFSMSVLENEKWINQMTLSDAAGMIKQGGDITTASTKEGVKFTGVNDKLEIGLEISKEASTQKFPEVSKDAVKAKVSVKQGGESKTIEVSCTLTKYVQGQKGGSDGFFNVPFIPVIGK